MSRLEQREPGDASEQLIRFIVNPNPYIANPCNLLWAHNVLGSKTLLYPTPEPSDYDIRIQAVRTEESFVPEIVRELVSAIKASPHLHSLLCRVYLNHIDVLDIHTSSLAAYIINQVPEIKAMLQKVKETIVLEPTEFAVLAENKATHLDLHGYLMGLKLLALSGDQGANNQLYSLQNSVVEFLRERTSAADYNEWCNHLIGHPFWGAYTQNSNSLNQQWTSIRYFKKDLDPNVLKSFWTFTSHVDPKIAGRFKNEYLTTLLGIYGKRGVKDTITNTVRALSEAELETFLPRGDSFHSLVEHMLFYGHIVPGILILNEAHTRLKDNPLLLKVRLDIARDLKLPSKMKRISEVEEFLQGVSQHKPEKFWAYCSSLDPQVANKWKHEYLDYLMTEYRRGDKEHLGSLLHSLGRSAAKPFLMPPPSGAYSRQIHMPIMDDMISSGDYTLAMPILEEARKQLRKDDPLHLKIGLYRAICILGTQDETRFPEAEESLQKVFDTFPHWADDEGS
ncbi:MAG TPA: hypothetical protein VMW10_03525, partial [Alphaproteobacteria bacterium]|nr:hypothetical protein [Alphaproteobacteria bacterium]